MLQVRQLREELLSARRDRAVGEAREAELRRELSSLKRQVRVCPQAPQEPQHCSVVLAASLELALTGVFLPPLQLEGVSPEDHRRLARELAERQRQCTTMELELRAALDKLEVYRWADDAAAAAPQAGSAPQAPSTAATAASQQPDEEKSVEELRTELGQLRQAMALQGEEVQKVRPPSSLVQSA